jgi:hypothetical protein
MWLRENFRGDNDMTNFLQKTILQKPSGGRVSLTPPADGK